MLPEVVGGTGRLRPQLHLPQQRVERKRSEGQKHAYVGSCYALRSGWCAGLSVPDSDLHMVGVRRRPVPPVFQNAGKAMMGVWSDLTNFSNL